MKHRLTIIGGRKRRNVPRWVTSAFTVTHIELEKTQKRVTGLSSQTDGLVLSYEISHAAYKCVVDWAKANGVPFVFLQGGSWASAAVLCKTYTPMRWLYSAWISYVHEEPKQEEPKKEEAMSKTKNVDRKDVLRLIQKVSRPVGRKEINQHLGIRNCDWHVRVLRSDGFIESVQFNGRGAFDLTQKGVELLRSENGVEPKRSEKSAHVDAGVLSESTVSPRLLSSNGNGIGMALLEAVDAFRKAMNEGFSNIEVAVLEMVREAEKPREDLSAVQSEILAMRDRLNALIG